MTLGVVLFIATLILLRDHRCLQRFTYTSGLAGIVLLLLPLPPGHRQRHQRRPDLDLRRRLQLPARRGRQGAAGGRLLRLPRPPPRRAGPGRPAVRVHRPAPRPRPRPDPRDVLVSLEDPGPPERPRLLAALLRPVPGHALRRHRAARLARRRRPAVRGRRAGGVPVVGNVQHRFNFWLHPFDYYDQSPGSDQLVEAHVRHGLGRPDRPRPRQRLPRADHLRRVRLHRRRRSARSSA